MSTPPPLRELERRLRELIFHNGDGSAAALARLERGAAELPIAGDGRLSPGERLSIYAGMHLLRIRDVLAEDFPATRAAAGDDFDRLVERYLLAHPTEDPSLRRAGRHLPRFLEHTARARFPWQADLAALEWAMIEAFDALDQEVLDAPALAALDPGDWPDLRIEPVRSLRILDLAFPVDEIRARLLAGEESPDDAPEPLALRVWRQGETVFHRRVGRSEARGLRLLGQGVAFGDLCGALGAEHGQEEAAREAVALLHGWLADGLLVALPTS